MTGPKTERPLFLDMDFGEALARYAQTKPEEVEPPKGKTAKRARPEPGASATPSSGEGGAVGGSDPEPE